MTPLTSDDIEDMVLNEEGKKARLETANHLKEKYHLATLEDTKELLIYKNGYYQNPAQPTIEQEIQSLWGENTSRYIINEIIQAHLIPQTYCKRDTFNINPNKTCLQNGILDITTLEITAHTPENKFTFQLPVEWNPEAACPLIEEFITQIVDKDDVALVYQVIGYCLWRGYPIQKAVMLVGDGSNGKSTLLNLIIGLLGKENVSGIALQELSHNRFAGSRLYGKHANLHPDLSDKGLKDPGKFKMATGGDPINAEKKFRDGFDFYSYAKLIYSANKLPEVTDTTGAFFRRWIIINFPNIFDDDTADKNLIDKLTTPEELSGLLKNSVLALQHLLGDGKFMKSPTTDELEERYTKLSNSIAAFAQEVIEYDAGGDTLSRSELFMIYGEYCRNNALIVKSQATFSKELKEYIVLGECKKGNDRAWNGIKFKEVGYRPHTLEDFDDSGNSRREMW